MRLMKLTRATRLSGKRLGDHLAAVLTVGLGVIVSLIVFRIVWKLEERTAAAAFERDAKNIDSSLRRSVEASLHEMESIAAFYAASREVNRHEFREFVKPFLARTPDIQALSWTPRVPGARRAAYEQAARRDGLPDFQITEMNVQGQPVKAAPRAEYFPVYFIEPRKGNEPALGFDLASEPTRLKTLNVLRDTGKVVASPPVRLVQEPGSQKGFLILWAIYRGDSPTDSVAWRRAHLAGLLSGVFRIGTLVEGALKHLEPRGFDVYVFDESAPQGQQLLYLQSSPAGRGQADFTRDQTAATLRTGLYHAATLDIAGWKWSIVSKPGPDYIGANTVWGPWALLLGGLASTAFLAMYMTERKRTEQSLLTLNEELERRVRGRTATVEATNTQLENEITERKRVQAEMRELLEETERARAALSSILEDQQQGEAALRESEEKFRILAEASVAAIFVFQGEQLRYANPAATTISGYANAELLNLRFWDLIHPDFRELVRQRGLARQRGETVQTRYEVKILTREGNERWVDFGGGFIMFEGAPAAIGVAFDITERKRAEEALLEKEHLLSESQRIASIGSWLYDMTGQLSWSDELYRIYGVSPDTFTPNVESFLNLIHPDDRPAMQAWIDACLAEEKPGDLEFRSIMPDGTVRFISGRGELMYDAENRPTYMAGTAQDITERKRVEEALKKSHVQLRALTARLAEAEDTERRRLSQELHDRVGQSLTALGISLSVARGEVAAGAAAQADARLEDALGLLGEAVERTRDVMGDLRPPVLDDYGLAAALRWHGERFAKRAGVAVLLKGDDPSPRLAASVETALFRIAQEALTNVAKHARARRVTLTLETADGTSRLIIADDGAGFDPKAPYPPGGPQRWGLLTMRERAEAVGGRLEVESTPGQGTRLVVEAGGGEPSLAIGQSGNQATGQFGVPGGRSS